MFLHIRVATGGWASLARDGQHDRIWDERGEFQSDRSARLLLRACSVHAAELNYVNLILHMLVGHQC